MSTYLVRIVWSLGRGCGYPMAEVLRDGKMVMACTHAHRTEDAARKCGEGMRRSVERREREPVVIIEPVDGDATDQEPW